MSVFEKQTVNAEKKAVLLKQLAERFEKNYHRHPNVEWNVIEEKIQANDRLLLTVYKMEETGGEPDIVIFSEGNEVAFVDCVKESPKGRRSVCYDEVARVNRKKYPPEMSAKDQASQIGIDLLTEKEYRQLQVIEAFDEKTSSWLETPEAIRSLGGAIFGDRRYNQVFVYHNGADSYYGARGYRGKVTL